MQASVVSLSLFQSATCHIAFNSRENQIPYQRGLQTPELSLRHSNEFKFCQSFVLKSNEIICEKVGDNNAGFVSKQRNLNPFFSFK